MFSTLKNITARGALIRQMARREIVSRYRASVLGMLWSFIQPLLMLGIYSFVFGHIMNTRWPVQGADVPGLFPLILFSGLILHGLLAECLARAPGLVVGQPNFVKKVVFPLEVLPVVMVASALFHFLISLLILLAGVVWVKGSIPVEALLVPLYLAPFLLICLGLGWGVSALGVYVRDVNHVIGLGITMLLFFSPILYPLEMLPEWARPWLMLNPLTLPVEALRLLLLSGQLPPAELWAGYAAASVVIALLGLCFFEKTRKGFADVL